MRHILDMPREIRDMIYAYLLPTPREPRFFSVVLDPAHDGRAWEEPKEFCTTLNNWPLSNLYIVCKFINFDLPALHTLLTTGALIPTINILRAGLEHPTGNNRVWTELLPLVRDPSAEMQAIFEKIEHGETYGLPGLTSDRVAYLRQCLELARLLHFDCRLDGVSCSCHWADMWSSNNPIAGFAMNIFLQDNPRVPEKSVRITANFHHCTTYSLWVHSVCVSKDRPSRSALNRIAVEKVHEIQLIGRNYEAEEEVEAALEILKNDRQQMFALEEEEDVEEQEGNEAEEDIEEEEDNEEEEDDDMD